MSLLTLATFATAQTPTSTAAGSSATLEPGYSFIRAVEDPNFHKYLQSEVLDTASDAVLGEPESAAQFQITDGQLVQNAAGGPLYAVVEPPADESAKKLKVTWGEAPDTLGSFVFTGDTVEWSSPDVTRPQNNVSGDFESEWGKEATLTRIHRHGWSARTRMGTRTCTSTLGHTRECPSSSTDHERP